jgi:hypothetical protein
VPVAQHIRRGVANATGNWQLALLAIGGRSIMAMALIFSLLIAIMPLVMAGVMGAFHFGSKEPDAFFRDFIFDHPFITIYALLVFGLIFIPVMVVYSFFEGAKADQLLAGERKAVSEAYTAFRAFDFTAWFIAGRKHWWPVFLILNIVWSVVLLVVLIPLAAAALIMLLSGGSESGLLAGCAIAVVSLPLIIVVSIVGNAWTQLAVLERAATDCGATEACRRAYRLFRSATREVVLTTLAMIGIAFGSVLSLLGLQAGLTALSHIPIVGLVTIPIQIVLSVISSALGAFLAVWVTAAYASLYRTLRPGV